MSYKNKRMEERPSQLEDVPDLFHRIQSMLPVKDAARTCILSKTWLHSWYTYPILNFRQMFDSKKQRTKHLKVVDRTLLRYAQHNIPIETIDLEIDINNHELASLAEKWIRQVATNTSLKDLSLVIHVSIASFTLPDEIFLGGKLNKISVMSSTNPLWMSSNPVIKCESLKVLELIDVHISEEALNNLLSTCSLLEKISLLLCKGLNTIKIKTLRYLSKLSIDLDEEDTIFEMDDVPNLCQFRYHSKFQPLTFHIGSLVGVTCLWLDGVKLDDAFFNMIESKFHFLEILILYMTPWCPQSFKITSPSLKALVIHLDISDHVLLDLIVVAPKLHFFEFTGTSIPPLLFPAVAPKKIKIKLCLDIPVDDFLFFTIALTLMLSSKFDIQISMPTNMPINMDIDKGLWEDIQRLWMRSSHFAIQSTYSPLGTRGSKITITSVG